MAPNSLQNGVPQFQGIYCLEAKNVLARPWTWLIGIFFLLGEEVIVGEMCIKQKDTVARVF